MKYFLFLLAMVIASYGFCQKTGNPKYQSIGISVGANQPNLIFKDAEGIRNKDLKGIPGITADISYQFGLNYPEDRSRFPLLTTLQFRSGYSNYKLRDNASTIVTNWMMQYWTNSLLLSQYLDSRKRVNPFYGIGLYLDYLIGGVQTSGFDQYNMTDSIERLSCGISGELGLTYQTSDESQIAINIGYSGGFNNLDKDEGEKAFLHSLFIQASTHFKLTK